MEMQSMAVMGGAAYQILLQSKLLVTALIMWVLRGQRQSTLQWNVLVTIALGMSAFVLAEDSSNQARRLLFVKLFLLFQELFGRRLAFQISKHVVFQLGWMMSTSAHAWKPPWGCIEQRSRPYDSWRGAWMRGSRDSET